jgi:hypothetical protein
MDDNSSNDEKHDVRARRCAAVGIWVKVMNGGGPVVFVNGKAKSCPLVDEIVAEYRAIGRH